MAKLLNLVLSYIVLTSMPPRDLLDRTCDRENILGDTPGETGYTYHHLCHTLPFEDLLTLSLPATANDMNQLATRRLLSP